MIKRFLYLNIISLFLLNTPNYAANDSTSIAPPNNTAYQTHKMIWYQHDIVLNGNNHYVRYIKLEKACPVNKGNIHCTITELATSNPLCSLSKVYLKSWFMNNNRYHIALMLLFTNGGSKCKNPSELTAKVTCSLVCLP